MLGTCFAILTHAELCVLVFQSYWWGRESDLLCFNCLLVSCGGQCYVALPHGAVGKSAVCGCGIS